MTVAWLVGAVALGVVVHLAVRPLRVRYVRRVLAASGPGRLAQIFEEADRDPARVPDALERHQREHPLPRNRDLLLPIAVQVAVAVAAWVALVARSDDAGGLARTSLSLSLPVVAGAATLTAIALGATYARFLARMTEMLGAGDPEQPRQPWPDRENLPGEEAEARMTPREFVTIWMRRLVPPVVVVAAATPLGVLVLLATWCVGAWLDPQHPRLWEQPAR